MALTAPTSPSERTVYVGRTGSVTVSALPADHAQTPAFVMAEKLAYIVEGTVQYFVLDLNGDLRGAELGPGSYIRTPPTLIHWLRNATDTDARVVEAGVGTATGEAGGTDEDVTVVALHAEWEDPATFPSAARRWRAASLYPIGTADEKAALDHPPVGLTRQADDVPELTVGQRLLRVPLQSTMARGSRLSVMVAARSGAYHSTPHIHPAEQINVVLRGSVWAYAVGPGDAYAAQENRTNDIFRIPNMAPHWAWSRSTEDSHIVEFHFPGLHGDPELDAGAVPLFADDPCLEPSLDRARNVFINGIDIALIEQDTA